MKFQDDIYYVDKVMNGDSSAYAFLVEKHKNLVFSIVIKVLDSREDAEEIAQDAFLKAYQSLGSFEKKSKFSTWLYRIAYNAAISKARKKKVEFVSMDENTIVNYSTDDLTESVHQIDPEERQQALRRALSALPAQDNLLISLFYKAEHSIEDISGITGLSESNVKVRLHRIRKKLYEEMNPAMQPN